MNSPLVIKRLKKLYPNKNIIALPEKYPTEILCEIDPVSEHTLFSVAVAVIDHSVPHLHKKSVETYTVLQGEIDLYLDGQVFHLKKGEFKQIHPFTIHHAIGKEAWIQCRSEPGWTKEDHYFTK